MKSLFGRLRQGLTRTREGLRDTVDRLSGQTRITEEQAEDLEEALLQADVSFETTGRLVETLRQGVPRDLAGHEDWAREVLSREITGILERPGSEPDPITATPRVILIVGVNGTGKTTTVGKLAALHRREGRSVLVVAADTFRAAANEQLARWAERAGVEIVQSQSGADPASVAFDGVKSGLKRSVDVILIDTAGRLHSKVGLMSELEKIHRVVGKAMEGAPHEVLLVLDGTTGQNAIAQARQFNQGLRVTGLVLTKIDGTARGGVVVSIADQLELPVRFVGVGEDVEDLLPFVPAEFAAALLAPSTD